MAEAGEDEGEDAAVAAGAGDGEEAGYGIADLPCPEFAELYAETDDNI